VISAEEIRARAARFWDNGRFLETWLKGEPFFPLVVPFRKPSARELLDDFGAIRDWLRGLRASSKAEAGYGYNLVYETRTHRQLGEQSLPREVRFDEAEDYLRFIGKERAFRRFQSLAGLIGTEQPPLRAWLESKPLAVLEHAEDWPALLAVLGHFQTHPRPGCYLRQLDIPGVDTKFIERHRGLLAELLDRVLAAEAIDAGVTGVRDHGFERRYGLRYPEPLVRFRVLDRALARRCGATDLSLPAGEFRSLELPCREVFVTENKINGLCFPDRPGGLVIFGLGYGIGTLRDVPWLAETAVRYWGDIDTHGFAILSHLRGHLPRTDSFLMDRETLLAHRHLWVEEPEVTRTLADLANLTAGEQALYRDLREDVHGPRVRLEQERIGFGYLQDRLSEIAP
jgi:hypothetical protein